ncbi:MAG: hypothetical protein FWE22_04415 [Firmicutes bacterium]|nr:hypothetical protein [Bacillota bacterium]
MKKMKTLKLLTVFAVALVLALSVFMFTACNETTFTVTFETGVETVTVPENPREVEEGQTFSLPTLTRANYNFDGWMIVVGGVTVGEPLTGQLPWSSHETPAGGNLVLRAVWSLAVINLLTPQNLAVNNLFVATWSSVANSGGYEVRIGTGTMIHPVTASPTPSLNLTTIPGFNALAEDTVHLVSVRAIGRVVEAENLTFVTSEFSVGVPIIKISNAVDGLIGRIRDINDIETLTMLNRPAVLAARADFEGLTDYQQALIPADVLAMLVAAEAAITAVEEALVLSVINQINALVFPVVIAHEAAINAADLSRQTLEGYGLWNEVPNEVQQRLANATSALAVIHSEMRVQNVINLINLISAENALVHADIQRIQNARQAYNNLHGDEERTAVGVHRDTLTAREQRVVSIVIAALPSEGIEEFYATFSNGEGGTIRVDSGTHPVLVGTVLTLFVNIETHFDATIMIGSEALVGTHTVLIGTSPVFSLDVVAYRLVSITQFGHGFEYFSAETEDGSIGMLTRLVEGTEVIISWELEELFGSELRINGNLITTGIDYEDGVFSYAFFVTVDSIISLNTRIVYSIISFGDIAPEITLAVYIHFGDATQRINVADDANAEHRRVHLDDFRGMTIDIYWSWTHQAGFIASVRENDGLIIGDEVAGGDGITRTLRDSFTIPNNSQLFDLQYTAEMVRTIEQGVFDFGGFEFWGGNDTPAVSNWRSIENAALATVLSPINGLNEVQYISDNTQSFFIIIGQQIAWFMPRTQNFRVATFELVELSTGLYGVLIHANGYLASFEGRIVGPQPNGLAFLLYDAVNNRLILNSQYSFLSPVTGITSRSPHGNFYRVIFGREFDDQLDVPVVTVDAATLIASWNIVPHATSYRVYVDGVNIATVSGTSIDLNLFGLEIGSREIQVIAVGGRVFVDDEWAWLESRASAVVSFVMTAQPSNQPFHPPVFLDVSNNMVLSWTGPLNANAWTVTITNTDTNAFTTHVVSTNSLDLRPLITVQGRYSITVRANERTIASDTWYASVESEPVVIHFSTTMFAPETVGFVVPNDPRGPALTWSVVDGAVEYRAYIYVNGTWVHFFTGDDESAGVFIYLALANPNIDLFPLAVGVHQFKVTATNGNTALIGGDGTNFWNIPANAVSGDHFYTLTITDLAVPGVLTPVEIDFDRYYDISWIQMAGTHYRVYLNTPSMNDGEFEFVVQRAGFAIQQQPTIAMGVVDLANLLLSENGVHYLRIQILPPPGITGYGFYSNGVLTRYMPSTYTIFAFEVNLRTLDGEFNDVNRDENMLSWDFDGDYLAFEIYILRDGDTEKELITLTRNSQFYLAAIQPLLEEGDQVIVKAVGFSGSGHMLVVYQRSFTFDLTNDVVIRATISDGEYSFNMFVIWGQYWGQAANWLIGQPAHVAAAIQSIMANPDAPNANDSATAATNTFINSIITISGNQISWQNPLAANPVTVPGGFPLNRTTTYTLEAIAPNTYRLVFPNNTFLSSFFFGNMPATARTELIYHAVDSILELVPVESTFGVPVTGPPRFRVFFEGVAIPDGTYTFDEVWVHVPGTGAGTGWQDRATNGPFVNWLRDQLVANFNNDASPFHDDAYEVLNERYDNGSYASIAAAALSFAQERQAFYLSFSFVVNGNILRVYRNNVFSHQITYDLVPIGVQAFEIEVINGELLYGIELLWNAGLGELVISVSTWARYEIAFTV